MNEASAIPAEVLEGFRESLTKLRGFQRRAVDSLYAGDYKEGGDRLKVLFNAWGDFLQGIRDLLPCLPGPLAESVSAAVAGTRVYLQEVQAAIVRKDWVETADRLGVDGGPLFVEWEAVFSGGGSPDEN